MLQSFYMHPRQQSLSPLSLSLLFLLHCCRCCCCCRRRRRRCVVVVVAVFFVCRCAQEHNAIRTLEDENPGFRKSTWAAKQAEAGICMKRTDKLDDGDDERDWACHDDDGWQKDGWWERRGDDSWDKWGHGAVGDG